MFPPPARTHTPHCGLSPLPICLHAPCSLIRMNISQQLADVSFSTALPCLFLRLAAVSSGLFHARPIVMSPLLRLAPVPASRTRAGSKCFDYQTDRYGQSEGRCAALPTVVPIHSLSAVWICLALPQHVTARSAPLPPGSLQNTQHTHNTHTNGSFFLRRCVSGPRSQITLRRN